MLIYKVKKILLDNQAANVRPQNMTQLAASLDISHRYLLELIRRDHRLVAERVATGDARRSVGRPEHRAPLAGAAPQRNETAVDVLSRGEGVVGRPVVLFGLDGRVEDQLYCVLAGGA